jgi:hypothetical protein
MNAVGNGIESILVTKPGLHPAVAVKALGVMVEVWARVAIHRHLRIYTVNVRKLGGPFFDSEGLSCVCHDVS